MGEHVSDEAVFGTYLDEADSIVRHVADKVRDLRVPQDKGTAPLPSEMPGEKAAEAMRFFYLPSDAVRILCHGVNNEGGGGGASTTESLENAKGLDADDLSFQCKKYVTEPLPLDEEVE